MNLSFNLELILIIAFDIVLSISFKTLGKASFKSSRRLVSNSLKKSFLSLISVYKLAISIQITLCLFKCSKYELSFAIFSFSNKDRESQPLE